MGTVELVVLDFLLLGDGALVDLSFAFRTVARSAGN